MPEIQQPWLVSFLPPSPTLRRAALAVSTFLLVAFVITIPFAEVMLPRLNIYIPLVATVMFLNDLITASLLLVQFSIARSRTLLLLANGYLFTALIAAVYGLVWPGAFHPTGLFGAGPETPPWLYLVWHAGLPTSVIVYALLKSKEHETPPVPQDSVRTFIFASVTCNILIVCGLTWFVTQLHDVLPILVTSVDRASAFSNFGTSAILIVSIGALVLQWRGRRRSVLDLWLSVVTLAWLLGSIMLTAIGARYDVAWYATPGFSVVSAIPVLLVLLSESVILHAQFDLKLLSEYKRAEEQLRTSELERARAEHALRDAREKLAQASKIATVAELSATVAHEINQPLQAVVANGHACLRWLAAMPPNVDKATRTADRIVRDGNAAADVVNRIRALFKHATPAKVDLDLNELILQVCSLMADEIQGSEVSLETEPGEDVPTIRADAVQIQQVIVNLVRNAIEAMAATMERPKPLWIRSRREGDNVVVAVQDHGMGLADFQKIFEPFVTTKEAGMGMGLAICRSIIEAHAGRIWAARNPERGVTFSFSLPIES